MESCGDYPGSSPRLRGTASGGPGFGRSIRFIPAPAGNSLLAPPPSQTDAVHPRACGEQGPDHIRDAATVGSSPRLRGTGHLAAVVLQTSRFIPAPAGNSCSTTRLNRVPPVHPRACGEQVVGVGHGASYCGSSPRLRGTVQGVTMYHLLIRFIPAPAGNSSTGKYIFEPFAKFGVGHEMGAECSCKITPSKGICTWLAMGFPLGARASRPHTCQGAAPASVGG